MLDNDTSRISAESHLIPGQRLRANTNTEDKKKKKNEGSSEGKKSFPKLEEVQHYKLFPDKKITFYKKY